VLSRRNRDDGGRDHLLHDNPEVDSTLTRTLRTKLRVAGFDERHLDVIAGFDRSYPKPYSKVVQYKGLEFKASVCPVIVAGTPEAVRFAYDVGIGELTGCCLGFLKSVK
jgi:CRISPR/Cas system endoribonuclease Cas6 (RAMP superfamily)